MQTSSGAPGSCVEQTGVLEHHVGQLPQQVVEQHQVARPGRHGRGRPLQPDDVSARLAGAGGARRRARAGSDPRPRPGVSRSTGARVVGRADHQQDVARAGPAAATTRRASAPSTLTAGSARLPTMTGWTNSTATWRPWDGHCGATHHMVAPAANRRARVSAAAARSSAGRTVLERSAGDVSTTAIMPRPARRLARQPATAAWPSARPPSLGGTRRWVRTCEAPASSAARARRTRRTFWNTPPLSATRLDPGLVRASRSAASAMRPGHRHVEAGRDRAGGGRPAHVVDHGPQHRAGSISPSDDVEPVRGVAPRRRGPRRTIRAPWPPAPRRDARGARRAAS